MREIHEQRVVSWIQTLPAETLSLGHCLSDIDAHVEACKRALIGCADSVIQDTV